MFDRDQAAGLRQLFTRLRPEVILACGGAPQQAQVVAELGLGMAGLGREVLIIDGSAGEIAQVMGLAARYELGHVVAGDKQLAEVLLEGAPDLRILPAMRGLDQLWRLPAGSATSLKRQFARQLAAVETLIVNCRPLGSPAAGRAFQSGAHVLVVLSEHPESITMAYREIKALKLDCGVTQYDVIMSESGLRARAVFDCLADTARQFLGVTLTLQGNLSCNRLEAAVARGLQGGDAIEPVTPYPIARAIESPQRDLGYFPVPSSRSSDRGAGRV
jgi:flagellar biosynthesis protein FlhG